MYYILYKVMLKIVTPWKALSTLAQPWSTTFPEGDNLPKTL